MTRNANDPLSLLLSSLSLQLTRDGHRRGSLSLEDTDKGVRQTNSTTLEVSLWMTRTRWSLLTGGITASWNGSEVLRVAQCWPVATGEEIDLISWNGQQMWSSTKRPTVSSSASEGIVEWHDGHVEVAPEAEKRSTTTSIVYDWRWMTKDLSMSLTPGSMQWDAIAEERRVASWWLVDMGKVRVFISSMTPPTSVWMKNTLSTCRTTTIIVWWNGWRAPEKRLSWPVDEVKGRIWRSCLHLTECGSMRQATSTWQTGGMNEWCAGVVGRSKALSWWVEMGEEKEQISSIIPLVCPSIVMVISMSLTRTIIEFNDFHLKRTE